jgi:CelD/BcsL family acetyltransferase involved in cellulose biosynthesis
VRIIVHREIPADQQLRHQWNALVCQMDLPQVFYTWEWAMAVDRAYGSSLKPLLLLAYDGEDLAGVAALATRAGDGEKDVVFLAGNTADYCDFICDPKRNPEVVEAVFAELQKLQLPVLRLANLPTDSPTSRTLKPSAAMHGYHTFSRPAYQCIRIVLGSEAQRRELKKGAVNRKAYRYCLKGLEKKGAVTLDHLRQADAIQANLPSFIEAHVARFAAAGRSSNLASPERQAFLKALAELLSHAGQVVLTRLLVDGKPVAWNYGFDFAGSWFYYQPTFDGSVQQYSPGLCLLTKMIECACDRQEIELLDLGLGQESYKNRFASTHRETQHATVTKSSAAGFRERVRYHAASAVRSSPRLEHWVRRMVGRPSSEM